MSKSATKTMAAFLAAAIAGGGIPATAMAAEAGGAVEPLAATTTVERVYGAEAPHTAVEVSKRAFPEGASAVVIARADDFADAMSATGLAGALRCPILTTDRERLTPAVLDEVARLGAKRAYVIGGKGAIPADVEGELGSRGVGVMRVFGEAAWDTSVSCAHAISSVKGASDDAVVATSMGFQDALSMSAYAYKAALPVYLTDPSGSLPPAASSALSASGGRVYVAGGELAVPRRSAEGAFGSRVVRIAGLDGYDTSNQVATYLAANGMLGRGTVVVASGAMAARGADALAGSALAAKHDAPMLLVSGNAAMEPENWVTLSGRDHAGTEAFASANAPSRAYVLGGLVPITSAIDSVLAGGSPSEPGGHVHAYTIPVTTATHHNAVLRSANICNLCRTEISDDKGTSHLSMHLAKDEIMSTSVIYNYVDKPAYDETVTVRKCVCGDDGRANTQGVNGPHEHVYTTSVTITTHHEAVTRGIDWCLLCDKECSMSHAQEHTARGESNEAMIKIVIVEPAYDETVTTWKCGCGATK